MQQIPLSGPLPLLSVALAPALLIQRLVRVRWYVLAVLAALLLAAHHAGVGFALWPPLLLIALLAVWNWLAARYLARQGDAGVFEVVSQIVLDLLGFAALVFFTGGPTNPMVSLLLLPVVVAALVLPGRIATGIALAAIALYSGLLNFHLPLVIADVGRATWLHLAGMWLTFVVSAIALTTVAVRLTGDVRARDLALAQAREQCLRDERILALGTLAAGAAHELGTPLATMTLLLEELRADQVLDAQSGNDLDTLAEQIARCTAIVRRLGERAHEEDQPAQAVADWAAQLHRSWCAWRPRVDCALVLDGPTPGPPLERTALLEQAVINLLDNAARTSRVVRLLAQWDEHWLSLSVADRGSGFSDDILRTGGKAPVLVDGQKQGNQRGQGIGLLLTGAAIERLGGTLELSNPADGGGLATLRLPIRGN